METSRVFLIGLGSVAISATAAILSLEVALAYGLWSSTSPTRIVAVVASVTEATILAALITKFVKHIRGTKRYRWREPSIIWLTLDLIASILASLLSAALLIWINKVEDLPDKILTIPWARALIGSSIALGAAFVGQISFTVFYFISRRIPATEQAYTNEEGRLSPQIPMRVKTVPYNRTKPAPWCGKKERASSEYSIRPGTSGGTSTADTRTSMSESFSSTVRPTGSKARLLSYVARSGRRPDSQDSDAYRDRNSDTGDGFDSWDTSSVDSQNRQMVLETSSPVRTRFLETIPASPATSRSPSPGCPLECDTPKRGLKRSYTALPRTPEEGALTPRLGQWVEAELNIHPLFRSDSPGPPPPTTPGTVVVAAPNAGQIITGKIVTRMRAGNVPNTPSPLSRQGSYESFQKASSQNDDRPRPDISVTERCMTPPIPEWLLNAGSKDSLDLAEYPSQR
ncbi:hypothetical protein GGS20DRAFT_353470 [Poronia punctata]|nr:hypothetical protein GGS20DRAFT_353470 [Poronia punctata]